jgi:GTPase Era involved in 16S rRNA processing
VSTPVFAIVGHPNKGKSSIVSTLARDESVAISPLPGTTIDNREYPMIIDGETLYLLIDTPGFQRARAALEWMQAHTGSSVDRADTVRRFLQQHRSDPRFAAECRLLTPLLQGAGILYVVDGSRPFGEEYEAEMEILRWTGQPSLALINMIGDANYSAEWSRALGQYFRIVRVFNAMTADFDKRVQLLRAFGQIREDWREPLERAVQILAAEQAQRRKLSARIIAETLGAMLTHTCQRRLTGAEAENAALKQLRNRYQQDLVGMEQQCRSDVEQAYDYTHVERHESVMELLDADLFAAETWNLFGLTRRQLIATGSAGGAAAGSVIDVATGGHSLLLGAGIGALIGGVSAWVGAERIAHIKVLGSPLGGKALTVGPMRSINFPYVVLGRALLHHKMIEDRTHAQRGPIELTRQPGGLQSLDADGRKRLEKLFTTVRKQDALKPELLDRFAEQIEALMASVAFAAPQEPDRAQSP